MSTRPEILSDVRREIQREFPAARLSTNDDANPATPYALTASWKSGRIVKVVRADSISSTPEQFIAKAISVLTPFQKANVPARDLQ